MLLQSGGFVKGSQTQPPEAIHMIAMLMFIGTAGLLLLAMWQALTFHLNKQTHKIFIEEVERLRANGAKQAVTPQARQVVEDLTGYDYDRLWTSPEPARQSEVQPAGGS
jgi:oligogalacturonide transporter